MPSWTVLPVPVPESLDSPDAWALHGAARVSYTQQLATWGYTDLMYPAGYLLADLRPQPYSDRRVLVAVPEGVRAPTAADVVGLARIVMPLADNTHLADLEVYVDPAHTDEGVGDALLAGLERIAADNGRTSLLIWSEHKGEPAAGVVGVLEPPTGSGRIRSDDAGARFAARHGYALGQAERYSVLRLPVDPDLLDRLHADAAAAAGTDYRLHTWRDRVPDEWVDQVAHLEARMSTDAPSGDLDIEATAWDGDRIRTWEAQVAASNHGYVMVAAEHAPTRTLAAFTVVRFPVEHEEVVFQDDTLVLAEHRGHRLGMLIKAEQLRTLPSVRPHAARVHTWNAEENRYMLAINVALGFAPAGVGGAWQKRLA
jgi:GNAT superfamily N-acetyltransferase